MNSVNNIIVIGAVALLLVAMLGFALYLSHSVSRRDQASYEADREYFRGVDPVAVAQQVLSYYEEMDRGEAETGMVTMYRVRPWAEVLATAVVENDCNLREARAELAQIRGLTR